MFRQIAPDGVVTKGPKKVAPGDDLSAALEEEPLVSAAAISTEEAQQVPAVQISNLSVPKDADVKHLNELVSDLSVALEALKAGLAGKEIPGGATAAAVSSNSSPESSQARSRVGLQGVPVSSTPAIDSVVEDGTATKMTHEEMLNTGTADGVGECPFLGNQ
jgi:hypothetical protein